MTILRSGTTQKYSDNWGAAFGKKTSKGKTKPVAVKKSKPVKKKAAKKAKKK